jgi:pimeloyl-ACP methyl ester carboxylesterase
VVGHSTGGLIALHCLRSAPDLFSRALLINPVSADGLETTPERLEGYLDMSRNRPQCEKIIESTIHGGFPDAELGSRIVDDAFGVHPLIWQGVPRMLQAADIRSDLPQIFHPVLVLHGTKDWVLPLEASRELAQSLPRGKFLALDGRGHSCNVEDPKLLLTHLNKFLFG